MWQSGSSGNTCARKMPGGHIGSSYVPIPVQMCVDFHFNPSSLADPLVCNRRLTFDFPYQLPIGHGKAFLSQINPALNQVIGGWLVIGITTMLSGQYLNTSFSGIDPANASQSGGRPGCVGNGNRNITSGNFTHVSHDGGSRSKMFGARILAINFRRCQVLRQWTPSFNQGLVQHSGPRRARVTAIGTPHS